MLRPGITPITIKLVAMMVLNSNYVTTSGTVCDVCQHFTKHLPFLMSVWGNVCSPKSKHLPKRHLWMSPHIFHLRCC